MENKSIKESIAKYKLGLKVIIIVQILFYIIFRAFFQEIILAMEFNNYKYALYIFSFVVFVFYVFTDVLYWNAYIKKLKKLLYVRPVKCVVEDMIVTSYRRNDRMRYKLSFLVKGLEDEKLYYTYGRYKVASYTIIHSYMNNSLLGISAVRKDRTAVEIGDIIKIYINKMVDIAVDVDYMADTVKFDGEKYPYIHANMNYDASVFEKVNFFDGALDIENDI